MPVVYLSFHDQETAQRIQRLIESEVLEPSQLINHRGGWILPDHLGTSDLDGSTWPLTALTPCPTCGNVHHREGLDGSLNIGNGSCSASCANDQGWFYAGEEWIDTEDCEDRLLSWDSVNDRQDDASSTHPYLFGLEVEKEDHEARSVALSEALTRGWIAVSDGSLDSGGFELVSPAYNLTDPSKVREWKEIISHWHLINAESSRSCGGHITVSKRGLSGLDLMDAMGDAIPLLMSCYRHRLRGTWSVPVVRSRTEENGNKYRAFNVKSNRIEFRLFSAVQTGDQLLSRIDLLRECLRFTERDQPMSIAESLETRKGPIWDALENLYGGDQDKLDSVRGLFPGFKRWYNGEHDAEKDQNIRTFVRNGRE